MMVTIVKMTALVTMILAMSGCGSFSAGGLDGPWRFVREDVGLAADAAGWESVTIPHTYNRVDAMNGGGKDMRSRDGYYRGPAWYAKTFSVSESTKNKRLFLRFEGVGSVADVYLNGEHLGQHKGAFGAFCYELTPHLVYGGDNVIRVRADNMFREDVAPLSGDFPVFGGIYRPVHLIVKEQSCITPLDYASSGVYLTQKSVSKEKADVEILTKLSHVGAAAALTVESIFKDANGTVVKRLAPKAVQVSDGKTTEVRQSFSIDSPRLWNGLKDPYLYSVTVELKSGDTVLDSVTQPLGLRYFKIDGEKGFYLNGERYTLYGVNRHQDWKGKGWAISNKEHDVDMEMIREIGARAVRLAHYPHASYFYDLCDKAGLLVWAEIPLVDCISDDPGFAPNAREQLVEMVRQHYNHPSIFCWGLFNEMYHRKSANAIPLLKELHALNKQEDPTRYTTGATNRKREDLCNITDLLAFNGYPGWYGGGPEGMDGWLSSYQKAGGNRGIAVSEYGAGASILHQEDPPSRTKPKSNWHPEQWQSIVHEENYRSISQCDYCWGSFVWNMFDFASVWRDEGDAPGKNDKGLVTHDRKVRKDAFYFYKANWSDKPVVYITSRRHTQRTQADAAVKVYSNAESVTLHLNGETVGTAKPDEIQIVRWSNLTLQDGDNVVEVTASIDGKTITDRCVWNLEKKEQ